MALDEPKEDDTVHQIEGISFVVATKDEPTIGEGTVRVDHVTTEYGSGFIVSKGSASGCC